MSDVRVGFDAIIWLGGVMVAIALFELWLLWRLGRALERAEAITERVGRLADALTLLTETSELGFRVVSREVERIGACVTRLGRPMPLPSRPPAAEAPADAARPDADRRRLAVEQLRRRLRDELAAGGRVRTDTAIAPAGVEVAHGAMRP
jgi:hypothetical protein